MALPCASAISIREDQCTAGVIPRTKDSLPFSACWHLRRIPYCSRQSSLSISSKRTKLEAHTSSRKSTLASPLNAVSGPGTNPRGKQVWRMPKLEQQLRGQVITSAASGTVTGRPEDEDDGDEVIRFPLLTNLPYLLTRRVRRYFRTNPWRRALFGGIALFLGFYVAQTVSLTLGALSLNDVVAAAFCVVFTESVTRFYHTRERPTFPQALLNVFKMGFTYGLMIDAFKLAS